MFHFSRIQGTHCLLQQPGGDLLTTMMAHKEAEGNPLPHATPFRPNLTAHFASLKMCTLHTSLTVQNGPWPIIVVAEDATLLYLRPILALSALQSTLFTLEST